MKQGRFGRSVLAAVASALIPVAGAAADDAVVSPARGVLCDAYFCADSEGISDRLTARYLGRDAADRLAALGDFDRSAFTLSNGIFCDAKARRCHEDRYFDPGTGERSPVSVSYTRKLFGCPGASPDAGSSEAIQPPKRKVLPPPADG